MLAELVAIIVCSTAASSYATFKLVTRHLSARLDSISGLLTKEVHNQASTVRKLQTDSHNALVRSMKVFYQIYFDALDNVERRHLDTLNGVKQDHADSAVALHKAIDDLKKTTVVTSAVAICRHCGLTVARFELDADGLAKCANCKKAGK